MSKIVCFGEVLWDVFPKHKKIGGAPLNVALRLQSFQNEVALISCLGDDKLGNELLLELQKHRISSLYIQKIKAYKTSTVAISLDKNGSASYFINHPCAWDNIQVNDKLNSLVKSSEAFIFGSLIARSNTSRNTLLKLLTFSKLSVFDVNLRPPHYDINSIQVLMNAANFIKFNDDELKEISMSLGYQSASIEQTILFIAKKTNTTSIAVTLGSKGAILFYEERFFYCKGYQVEVADTVGSGDSFLATLIDVLLKGKDAQLAIDKACAVGALVAKNKGANPLISDTEINAIMNQDVP
jgi:fructokinase